MKIFCIGLNKTATVSLHTALERLGFNSLHWGGEAAYLGVQRALEDCAPLLSYVPEADAYSDIEPLSLNFRLADEQYPGSKFIVTVRDLDGWLDSRRRHVERNIARKERGEYDGSWVTINDAGWRMRWTNHHRRIADHFRQRPNDLLVMNIIAGDGWELLAPFLDQPIPDEPFPFQNQYLPAAAGMSAAD